MGEFLNKHGEMNRSVDRSVSKHGLIRPVIKPFSVEVASGFRLIGRAFTSTDITNMPVKSKRELVDDILLLNIIAFPTLIPKFAERQAEFIQETPVHAQRQLLILNDESSGLLVAAALFDQSVLVRPDADMEQISIIYRIVDPGIQAKGVGKLLSATILNQLQPDILTTSCAQSASLWSWINTVQKGGLIKKYDIYPHLKHTPRGDRIIDLPLEQRNLALAAYRNGARHVYRGENIEARISETIALFDIHMVARNFYKGQDLYNEKAWKDNDVFTKRRSLNNRDAVFVVCLKR